VAVPSTEGVGGWVKMNGPGKSSSPRVRRCEGASTNTSSDEHFGDSMSATTFNYLYAFNLRFISLTPLRSSYPMMRRQAASSRKGLPRQVGRLVTDPSMS